MVVPPVAVNFMNLKIDGGKKRWVYGVIVVYITIIIVIVWIMQYCYIVYVGDMFFADIFHRHVERYGVESQPTQAWMYTGENYNVL